MKLSYIMACLNAAQFIHAALDSLRRQDHPADEIIVVDDGSTDGSAEIAMSFDMPGLRVIRQDFQGVVAARAAGTAASSGDIIGYFDADDIAPPGRTAALMAQMLSNPDLDACIGRWENFWDEEIPREIAITEAARYGGPRDTPMRTACLYRRATAIDLNTLLASVLESDPTASRTSDRKEWFVRLQARGKIGWIDDIVLQRRVHMSNTSRKRTVEEVFALVRAAHLERKANAIKAPSGGQNQDN